MLKKDNLIYHVLPAFVIVKIIIADLIILALCASVITHLFQSIGTTLRKITKSTK
jgi:hypothetical protein